jgi:hypothetical protein
MLYGYSTWITSVYLLRQQSGACIQTPGYDWKAKGASTTRPDPNLNSIIAMYRQPNPMKLWNEVDCISVASPMRWSVCVMSQLLCCELIGWCKWGQFNKCIFNDLINQHTFWLSHFPVESNPISKKWCDFLNVRLCCREGMLLVENSVVR